MRAIERIHEQEDKSKNEQDCAPKIPPPLFLQQLTRFRPPSVKNLQYILAL
jgi:hypothetical protein